MDVAATSPLSFISSMYSSFNFHNKADMDLHAVKECKCFRCVLPAWSFHSTGSLSLLFKDLLSFFFSLDLPPSDDEGEAAALAHDATVLFLDSSVAAYLFHAAS